MHHRSLSGNCLGPGQMARMLIPQRAKFCPSARHSATFCLVPHVFYSPDVQAASYINSLNILQRSEEWFALRKEKLTTSTFSTALGFWKGKRLELWREKVFPFDPSNPQAAICAAMQWGLLKEATAIEKYKSITGSEVGSLGFVIHLDDNLGWLGASPDGILGSVPGGGILEVKCPFNKGKPELSLPWSVMPYYYMPQVQGQMEIMDREWLDLYCWTQNGSTLFRVMRDREYWGLIYEILKEFWWGCVVPAREAVRRGREVDTMLYEPAHRHQLTGGVVAQSMKLAARARIVWKEIGGQLELSK